jgi:hypothetical protein
MTLIDSWMPTYDVAVRYAVRVGAPPAQVYATLLATDFGRPWLVRGLMGVRLLPALLHSPGLTWRRLLRPSRKPHIGTDLTPGPAWTERGLPVRAHMVSQAS